MREKNGTNGRKTFLMLLNIYSCEERTMAFIFRILYLGMAVPRNIQNAAHTEYILAFLLLSSKSISLLNNVFFRYFFFSFSRWVMLFIRWFFSLSSLSTSIAKVLGKRKCTTVFSVFFKSARKIHSVNNYFKYLVLFFCSCLLLLCGFESITFEKKIVYFLCGSDGFFCMC